MLIPRTKYIQASFFRVSRKSLISVLLGLCYALFVIIFPWEMISRGGFPDFDNYVFDYNYLIPSDVSAIEFYKLSLLLEYFTNEVLWVELVRRLTLLTGDGSTALRIISFFILFIWGQFLFKRCNYGVALLFLFNPFAIDVAMSGIRNGLAYLLVIVGLTLQSKNMLATLFLVGTFIHTSTIVFAFLYYFTRFAVRLIKGKMLIAIGLGISLILGIALTVFSESLFSLTGDRRLSSGYFSGGGSLLLASLWAFLLYFQCTSGQAYVKKNIFIISLLAFYLVLNLFIPWSFRIWASFLPVIALSAMALPPHKYKIFIFLYTGYLLLQYAYWTKAFYYWYPV